MRGAHLLSMHGFEMQNSRSSRHLKRLTGILIPTSTVRYSMSSRHFQFIDRRDVALFLGKPGTGKTHLALALGVRAVHRGVRVYCSSMKRLSQQIIQARAKNSLDTLFKKILGARLWIIDDWAVVSMRQEVAEEVFDLLDRRRHSSALILTSNRDVDEWGTVFPDPVLASAAIDRLFHNAHIATFTGQSYRLKGRIGSTRQREIQKTNESD